MFELRPYENEYKFAELFDHECLTMRLGPGVVGQAIIIINYHQGGKRAPHPPHKRRFDHTYTYIQTDVTENSECSSGCMRIVYIGSLLVATTRLLQPSFRRIPWPRGRTELAFVDSVRERHHGCEGRHSHCYYRFQQSYIFGECRVAPASQNVSRLQCLHPPPSAIEFKRIAPKTQRVRLS